MTSVNLPATLQALERSLDQVRFGNCILLTHTKFTPDHAEIECRQIGRLTSSRAYSYFILNELVDHIATSHCLLTQWDGHVLDAGRWRNDFMDFDYIGATWPQFEDGYDVGNGGFSLRSRQLMAACRQPDFIAHHPEDVAIGRTNRAELERRGIKFAPKALADKFSAERNGNPEDTFGYHGAFLMPKVLGTEQFWKIYRSLDCRSGMRQDLPSFIKGLATGPRPIRRSLRVLGDRVKDSLLRY
nr:DUF5672 family protein [Novosphingobium sp. PhB55]